MKIFFTASVLCLAVCFYRSGIAVTKCLAAALFVFRRSKKADNVSVNSCTGWARHLVPLHGAQSYEFNLDAQVTAGDVRVSLLDGRKNELVSISPCLPSVSVALNGAGRYYLRWEFKHATGKLSLRWHEA